MYSNSTFVIGLETVTFKKRLFAWKKVMLLLLFLGIPLLTFCQSSSITGIVIEKESTAIIANAIVAVEGTAFVESTNKEGKFHFKQAIPNGEHVVSVTKEGFEKVFFLIDVVAEKKLVVDVVQMEMTKQEKKRRKKEEKAKKKTIKDATKTDEKEDKELAKEEKKLKKDKKGLFGILGKKNEPEVGVTYEDIPEESEEEDEVVVEVTISPLQIKYADILDVAPEKITNIELYSFIDEWMGTPYLLGGETKAGIDCSSFTQRLFTGVYDWYIERTAQKQMESEATHTWADPEFLEEGDLMFFRAAGDTGDTITHVGVYLGNDKFVNATSRVGKSGSSGVKISNLSDAYWKKRFYAAGRRVNTKS